MTGFLSGHCIIIYLKFIKNSQRGEEGEMRSNQKERQETPRTYKMIHFKNTSNSGKRLSTNQNQKSSQYFPGKISGKEIENYYLDSSSASVSNREHSVSSRGLTMDSGVSSNVTQQNKCLKKEVKKLKLELLKYEKIVTQREDKAATLKRLQTELAETYRVIQYYQSKTQELQRVCKDYEQLLDSTLNQRGVQIKASQLLEQQRESNIELRVQLDAKERQITQMSRQLGNLSLKKVQNQYQIKHLQKLFLRQPKKRIVPDQQPKFVDDYQQQHLAVKKSNQPSTKKRTMLSRNKLTLKINSGGQSSGEESVSANEYRSTIYLRKKGTLRRDNSCDSNGMKATMYGNLQSKINHIEKEVQNLRKQNERLQKELDNKLTEILKVKDRNNELQMKLTSLQEAKHTSNANLSKKIIISKDQLRQIPKPVVPLPQVTGSEVIDSKLSMFVSNVTKPISGQPPHQQSSPRQKPTKDKRKTSIYKVASIKPLSIQKLLVNLIKSELSYQDLINLIASCWSAQNPNCIIEQLQGSPCNLSPSEAQEFMLEYTQVVRFISSQESLEAKKDLKPEQYRQYLKVELMNILRDIIPQYKNITFRREFSLNIQLSNKFKNFESEFNELVKKFGNKMSNTECEECFVGNWGLSKEEFMCILVKNYEEYGEIEYIHFAEIGKFYLTD